MSAKSKNKTAAEKQAEENTRKRLDELKQAEERRKEEAKLEIELTEKDFIGVDFYNVLGIDKNATIDKINSAFRRKSIQTHPDRAKDPQDRAIRNHKFKILTEIHKILLDPAKKQYYDQSGYIEQLRQPNFVPPAQPFSPFSSSSSSSSWPPPPPPASSSRQGPTWEDYQRPRQGFPGQNPFHRGAPNMGRPPPSPQPSTSSSGVDPNASFASDDEIERDPFVLRQQYEKLRSMLFRSRMYYINKKNMPHISPSPRFVVHPEEINELHSDLQRAFLLDVEFQKIRTQTTLSNKMAIPIDFEQHVNAILNASMSPYSITGYQPVDKIRMQLLKGEEFLTRHNVPEEFLKSYLHEIRAGHFTKVQRFTASEKAGRGPLKRQEPPQTSSQTEPSSSAAPPAAAPEPTSTSTQSPEASSSSDLPETPATGAAVEEQVAQEPASERKPSAVEEALARKKAKKQQAQDASTAEPTEFGFLPMTERSQAFNDFFNRYLGRDSAVTPVERRGFLVYHMLKNMNEYKAVFSVMKEQIRSHPEKLSKSTKELFYTLDDNFNPGVLAPDENTTREEIYQNVLRAASKDETTFVNPVALAGLINVGFRRKALDQADLFNAIDFTANSNPGKAVFFNSLTDGIDPVYKPTPANVPEPSSSTPAEPEPATTTEQEPEEVATTTPIETNPETTATPASTSAEEPTSTSAEEPTSSSAVDEDIQPEEFGPATSGYVNPRVESVADARKKARREKQKANRQTETSQEQEPEPEPTKTADVVYEEPEEMEPLSTQTPTVTINAPVFEDSEDDEEEEEEITEPPIAATSGTSTPPRPPVDEDKGKGKLTPTSSPPRPFTPPPSPPKPTKNNELEELKKRIQELEALVSQQQQNKDPEEMEEIQKLRQDRDRYEKKYLKLRDALERGRTQTNEGRQKLQEGIDRAYSEWQRLGALIENAEMFGLEGVYVSGPGSSSSSSSSNPMPGESLGSTPSSSTIEDQNFNQTETVDELGNSLVNPNDPRKSNLLPGNVKFRVPPSPLEQEARLKTMEPPHHVAFVDKGRILRGLQQSSNPNYPDGNNFQAEAQRISFQEQYQEALKASGDKFANDFRIWLQATSKTDGDYVDALHQQSAHNHSFVGERPQRVFIGASLGQAPTQLAVDIQNERRVPWTKWSPDLKNPEVQGYLDSYVDKRAEFEKRLIHLIHRGPKTLNEHFYYYKFVIRKEVASPQDMSLFLDAVPMWREFNVRT